MRGINARALGDSLEKEVLGILQSNSHYVAERSVRTPAGSACSDSDLLATYRDGKLAYSILVECKNHSRRVDKGTVIELDGRRRLIHAQCAILITRFGLRSGAQRALAEYPRLTHFPIDEFKSALQSGKVDDLVPSLVHSRRQSSSDIEDLDRLVRRFDFIATTMALVGDGNPRLHLRAAAQLIKASYARVLAEKAARVNSISPSLSELLPFCTSDVQVFLSEQMVRFGGFVKQWLADSLAAASSLVQERELYDATVLPWQRSFYKVPFQALKVVQNICCGPVDIDAPEFEHGGLAHVPQVLASLDTSHTLVAQAMYERLVSPSSANTKTVIAHLGRRFAAFRQYVEERESWGTLLQQAVESTIGTDLDRLYVRHNVAYCGAMFGGDADMADDVRSIECDSARMQAHIEMNLYYGRNNIPRILAMLNRKANTPPEGEQFVKDWSGILFKHVRAAAEQRKML